jgi:ubiquinone/menaquinone biosynthesis C-methylase UbiE
MENENKQWNKYWTKASAKKSFLGGIFTWYRKQVLARGVYYYHEQFFAKEGLFLECGSGSSQTSIQLKKHNRTYVAIDISEEALEEAKKIPLIDKTVRADIRNLPFEDNSVDGVWNLGVMEHFLKEDIFKILEEFKRVLKKEGTIILFWPVTYSPAHIFFEIIISLGRLIKKKIKFFPDEPSVLHSKKEARDYMEKAGFISKEFFNFRDGFTHIVIVARKK